MDDLPVQGRLRIRAQNYERDSAYIQPRVGSLSNARLKSTPGYDFLKFWYVDFAATPEQWAELAPELDRRNVLVTLFESPALLGGEEEEAADADRETVAPAVRTPYRRAPLAALAVAVGAIALAILLPEQAMWFLCMALLAFVAALVASVLVSLQEA